MFKQFFINKYFQKLSNTKFFRNDENAIIGKAKDIINNDTLNINLDTVEDKTLKIKKIEIL